MASDRNDRGGYLDFAPPMVTKDVLQVRFGRKRPNVATVATHWVEPLGDDVTAAGIRVGCRDYRRVIGRENLGQEGRGPAADLPKAIRKTVETCGSK